ncbi:hypothetical protein PSACC_00326 [Paramicrosporidium saccamoebae]|uniref:Uncharacterized protein n=1 Tax=Paramicrosporidium saccamoebae TaxID=1246581 RepID=A0A2H9TQ32_9FUNG|nr:hypothetical protein PSACC_00326 [Paramicrosporidium saccamoebae]
MASSLGLDMADSLAIQEDHNQCMTPRQHEMRTSAKYQKFLNQQLKDTSLRETITAMFLKDEPVEAEQESV